MRNVLGKNRPSPLNEKDYIEAYKKLNPYALKDDTLDIAAVISLDGIKGHGLLPQGINRSHDDKLHRVIDFIPDSELRKLFNSRS